MLRRWCNSALRVPQTGTWRITQFWTWRKETFWQEVAAYGSLAPRAPKSYLNRWLEGSATRRGFTSSAICRAGKQENASDRMQPVHREYWENVLQYIEGSTAREFRERLNWDFLYGIEPGVTIPNKVACFSFFCKVKKKHPKSVVLVQIGSFYEAIGIDAILLMEYGGLNPMGRQLRAGTPLANIHQLVHDLVWNPDVPLEVVVCNELNTGDDILSDEFGTRMGRTKDRAIIDVLNRANPNFDHGFLEHTTEAMHESLRFDESYPLLGIAGNTAGFIMYEVDVEMRRIRITDGQSSEAVDTRIQRGGICPPLYVHESVFSAASDRVALADSAERRHVHRARQMWRDLAGDLEEFRGANPLEQLKLLVCRKQGWDASSVSEFHESKTTNLSRPRPLYLSTACQLGIEPTRGVPSLLDSVLPRENAPIMLRVWMKQHLMSPPAPHVAMAVNEAVRLMLESDTPMPRFPVTRPKMVCKLINDKEVSVFMFRTLAKLCRAVVEVFQDSATRPFACEMLVPTSVASGLELRSDKLVETCLLAIERIESVAAPEGDGTQGATRVQENDLQQLPELERLQEFFNKSEECFRGRVISELIAEEEEQVKEKAMRVVEEVKLAYESLCKLASSGDVEPRKWGIQFTEDPAFKYKPAIETLVKKAKSAKPKDIPRVDFVHPKKDNGKGRTNLWITAELEDAISEYNFACAKAAAKTTWYLKELAGQLQGSVLQQLLAASWFAVGAEALIMHVEEGKRRGWSLPALNLSETQLSSGSNRGRTPERPSLEVTDMWPYWMSGSNPGTVRNSLSCDTMVLLTGPNMAGKSTVLRQVAACALLGASGLMAPCREASVPYIDAFLLRTFSHDSPREGVSSYGVECQEMASVQRDVTENSLLLVDELGKGTEVHSGTAMAAALLEELDASGCRGIFATHLHGLLQLELAAPHLQLMRMETREYESDEVPPSWLEPAADSKISLRKPTWRIVDGSSTESLALSVALDCGIKLSTVKRAAQILQELHPPQEVPSKEVSSARAVQDGPQGAFPDSHGSDGGSAQTDVATSSEQSPSLTSSTNRETSDGSFSPEEADSQLSDIEAKRKIFSWFRGKSPSTAAAALERHLQGESVEDIATTKRAKPLKESTVINYISSAAVESIITGPVPDIRWDELITSPRWSPDTYADLIRRPGIASLKDFRNSLQKGGSDMNWGEVEAVTARLLLESLSDADIESLRSLVAAEGDPPAARSRKKHPGGPPVAPAAETNQLFGFARRGEEAASAGAGGDAALLEWLASGRDSEVAAPDAAEREGRGLDDAKRVLRQVCGSFQKENGGAFPIIELRSGAEPPPSHSMTSCAYICCWESGWFYVGETDNIKSRLRDHRGSDRYGLTAGRSMSAVYVRVPQGKSAARRVEALLQQCMRSEGFPMLSDEDAQNKNFG